MPQESLRKNPLWRAEDLGKPIPNTKHAISMCLPRWQDVIGYEEKDSATMERLQLGYPRFFYHPLVEQAFEKFSGAGEQVQIYSSRKAAERCKAYLERNFTTEDTEQHGELRSENSSEAGGKIALRGIKDTACVLISFPAACADDAKDYWQHAGEGISSRCAEALLNETPPPDASEARKAIIARLAEFSGAPAENIYLFPTGMAAINAAFLAVQEMHKDRTTVQFAFPYGDTLKLQNKTGHHQPLFYPRGNAEELAALEQELQTTSIAGLFCEFPTNPLLSCVNLPHLRKLADKHRFPIILDETLGACINQNTLPYADASVISLTKFFSGTSNVMGGALIINRGTMSSSSADSGDAVPPCADRFEAQLKAIYEPAAFHPADIMQLEKDSRCCRERVEQINRIAQQVCEYLAAHPAVESVYYPSLQEKEMYDRFRRTDGGYGGLLSFVLRDAARCTEPFYDALEITKGPNLGTSFSLCCPFTLIAHYNELEWAEAAGASRYLIRISIGIEPAAELIARLDRAFAAVR